MISIDAVFKKLRQENREALMPFVTAGDLEVRFTEAVIKDTAEIARLKGATNESH